MLVSKIKSFQKLQKVWLYIFQISLTYDNRATFKINDLNLILFFKNLTIHERQKKRKNSFVHFLQLKLKNTSLFNISFDEDTKECMEKIDTK